LRSLVITGNSLGTPIPRIFSVTISGFIYFNFSFIFYNIFIY
jgi:hypothetical protein